MAIKPYLQKPRVLDYYCSLWQKPSHRENLIVAEALSRRQFWRHFDGGLSALDVGSVQHCWHCISSLVGYSIHILYTQLIPLYSYNSCLYAANCIWFCQFEDRYKQFYSEPDYALFKCLFQHVQVLVSYFFLIVRKHPKKLAYLLVINRGDPIKTSI